MDIFPILWFFLGIKLKRLGIDQFWKLAHIDLKNRLNECTRNNALHLEGSTAYHWCCYMVNTYVVDVFYELKWDLYNQLVLVLFPSHVLGTGQNIVEYGDLGQVINAQREHVYINLLKKVEYQ